MSFGSGYVCPESAKSLIDTLIATVDLLDVVDDACAFGRHGGDEHGNAGADVGRVHVVWLEV